MAADYGYSIAFCLCAHCMGPGKGGLAAEAVSPSALGIPNGPGIPAPPGMPTAPGFPEPPVVPDPPGMPVSPGNPDPASDGGETSRYLGPRYETLLRGDSWNGEQVGAPALVPYSFATRGYHGYAGSLPSSETGFIAAASEPLDAVQRAHIREALDHWERVSGLFFVEVPDPPEADFAGIRFFLQDISIEGLQGDLLGMAWRDGGAYGSNIFFNRVHYGDATLAPGTRGFKTALHEIGHAVGLKHPFDGSPVLPASEDNDNNTIMSYTEAGNRSRLGPFDVAAAQFLYGTEEQEVAAPVRWMHGPGGALVSVGNDDGNRITGLAVRDVAFGQGGDDVIDTRGGDDDVAPGAGNDTVFGGAGIDALVTGALRRQAFVSGNADRGAVALPDGTDAFYGVEILRFVDGDLHFHSHGAAGQAYRLYGAALGRAPDAIGLGGWTAALQTGALSLSDAATGFAGSAEFALRYGAPGDAEFVSLLYANVLGRAPEAGAVGHWTDHMHNGSGRAGVLLGFSESAEYRLKAAAAFKGGLWVADPEAVDVLRAYVAVLDRLPDAGGLAHWAAAREAGLGQREVVDSFVASAEFQGRFGGLYNRDFVEQLYRTALDRPADAAGLADWTRILDSGAAGRSGVALGFAQSDETAIKLAPLVADGFLFA